MIVFDFPTAGKSSEDFMDCFSGDVLSSENRKDGEFRHAIIRRAANQGIWIDENKAGQLLIIQDEKGLSPLREEFSQTLHN